MMLGDHIQCISEEISFIGFCLTFSAIIGWIMRDLLAELLEEICKDVVIQPPLRPLTGEKRPQGPTLVMVLDWTLAVLTYGPRAFIDVRIFNPQAQSNWNKSIPAIPCMAWCRLATDYEINRN